MEFLVRPYITLNIIGDEAECHREAQKAQIITKCHSHSLSVTVYPGQD